MEWVGEWGQVLWDDAVRHNPACRGGPRLRWVAKQMRSASNNTGQAVARSSKLQETAGKQRYRVEDQLGATKDPKLHGDSCNKGRQKVYLSTDRQVQATEPPNPASIPTALPG